MYKEREAKEGNDCYKVYRKKGLAVEKLIFRARNAQSPTRIVGLFIACDLCGYSFLRPIIECEVYQYFIGSLFEYC